MIPNAVHNGQRQWTMDPCLSKKSFPIVLGSVYKCISSKTGHPTKAAFKTPKGLFRLTDHWWYGYMNQRLQSPSTGRRPFRLQKSVTVIHKLHYHGESIEDRATRLVAWVNKSADRIWIYF